VPFAYTRPSPTRYPWQWYWDSCFAAIVWRRFESERSRAELESLLAAQREDGFVGHTIFWDRPVSLGRFPFYNVASRRSLQTETIQPPLLAWAWRIAVGDPGAEPRIGAQADWLARKRDLDGDGLLWIVQPDESGLDASPKFDPVWGRRANGRIGFPCLVRRNRRLGFDARRIRDRGGPVLCETLVNTLWSLSMQALGRPSVTPELVERLWDERHGLFLDEAQPGGGRGPIRRYWRGPTWVNAAWLLWLGLRRLGYHQEAERMANGLIGAVEREGLREYYDPRTGRGLGAKDFAWSALIAELANPDPEAASGYL
jgi:hypothetical protein